MRHVHRNTPAKTEREPVEYALALHQRAGRLLDWSVTTTDTRRRRYHITITSGECIEVSLHEAHAFVYGLASAACRREHVEED